MSGPPYIRVFIGTGHPIAGSSGSSVLRPPHRRTSHAVLGSTEKNRGGSGAKLDGAVPFRGWAPKRDISRLGTLGSRRNARSLRGSRGGSWPERLPTGHGRKASPLVRRRRLASFMKSQLRPPRRGLKSFRPSTDVRPRPDGEFQGHLTYWGKNRRHVPPLLRTERRFPHTSTPHPHTCAPGRFRGVDALHVPTAGPASQQRRVDLRHSPEAVPGPNPF